MKTVNLDFRVMDPSLDNLMNCSMSDDNYVKDLSGGKMRVVIPTAYLSQLVDILFGVLTVLVVMMALHVKGVIFKLSNRVDKKTVVRLTGLVLLAVLLPFITLLLTTAFAYKTICKVLIKRKDTNFVRYLDSFDVFWCLENETSKNIINVLGVIESDAAESLVNNIREKLQNLPMTEGTEKMFYTRCEKYGFYYWSRHDINSINLDQYVDVIDSNNGATKLNDRDLEDLMSDITTTDMPANDKGLFQILVTKHRVSNYDNDRGDYGIIFRVHHSVGDGLALIEFLCKTLADKYQKNTLMFPASKTKNNAKRNTFTNLIKMIKILLEMPICLIDGIVRKPDQNSLHGPKLLGRNVLKWTASNENILIKIKEIKAYVANLYFSDILSTALSKGLLNYFSKTMNSIPEEVAVILPVRFPESPSRPFLENNFSVTILDLPTSKDTNMDKVRDRFQNVRKSADPLTNYYFLKAVSGVLSSFILKPLLYSSQATLVLSNMPGPQQLSICGGDYLKSLVFFVPNKGTTGLGITALCYGGVLRFAAMADKALVSSSEDLAVILSGMEDEIDRLHRVIVQ